METLTKDLQQSNLGDPDLKTLILYDWKSFVDSPYWPQTYDMAEYGNLLSNAFIAIVILEDKIKVDDKFYGVLCPHENPVVTALYQIADICVVKGPCKINNGIRDWAVAATEFAIVYQHCSCPHVLVIPDYHECGCQVWPGFVPTHVTKMFKESMYPTVEILPQKEIFLKTCDKKPLNIMDY